MPPFSGVRVLDLTHVLAGPFASYQLATLGADVIKIENPLEPDQSRESGVDQTLNERGMGTAYLAQAAGKRAITLNLKIPQARDVLRRLAGDADVLVENYRPGALDALGLGAADLMVLNPRLIYCSISAFGHTGPRRHQTAYDIVIQATSGLMAMNGTPETAPIRLGAPLIDYGTGMTAAFAISAALIERAATGRGAHIDLAMFDVARLLMSSVVSGATFNGLPARAVGNPLPLATQGVFRTADGMLVVAANNWRQQRRFWEALRRPEFYSPTATQRRENLARDRRFLADTLLTRSAAEWECVLLRHRVPAAAVRNLQDALADPQTAARGLMQQVAAIDGDGRPIKVALSAFTIGGSTPKIDVPPRPVGADTRTILAEAGYSDREIDALARAGAL